MPETFFPSQNTLRKEYEGYAKIRHSIAKDLAARLEEVVRLLPSRPTIKARVKGFSSFFKKYIRLLKKTGPSQTPPVITDIIGVRIVCPFLEDVDLVEELIRKNFEVLEIERKGVDHTFREFGYESIHLLIKIPAGIIEKLGFPGCDTAEVQIRTILQDAWAEVEHELVYKAEFNPFDDPMKRKLAAVNASLSLADIIFQEIRAYQRQLNGELGKRRDSFFRKIEESTDGLLFAEERTENAASRQPQAPPANDSIDELLLNALYAHNKNQFSEAIAFYSRILELNPDDTIRSLIYKHRGMAYFARSHYEEAIRDFSKSLELDPQSYKAAYYRGIVCSVLERYDPAVESFNQSLAINPYQPYGLYRRGQAYYHLEDYPQALADCEAALALEPGNEALKKFRQMLLNKLKM
ncbi:MAG: tetratricopeptide repeat protein [Treponema sp.]|jgi:putative GTP pyrophosphokinase|nr:tetratricopeptide repeat protein [Treponema sp.]